MVAAVDYHRVVRAALAVQEQAGNLRASLAELGTRDYPNEDVALMIRELSSLCEGLSGQANQLSDAAEQFKNNAAVLSDAFRLLARYNQIVRFMHSYLAFLGDADVYALPNALSGSLRQKLAAVDQDAHVYLHADAEYNYFFSPIGKVLGDAFKSTGIPVGIDEKYAIVGFPKAENASTLSCLLLAHEVGHYLYQFRQLETEWVTAATAAGDWQRADDTLTSLLVDPKGQIQMDPVRVRNWWAVITGWLEEFAADRIAVHLAGPAFALAWLDFTVAMDDSAANHSHPSVANRVDELWEWFASSEWGATIIARVEPRTPWVSSVRASADLATAGLNAPADVAEAIRAAVKCLLPHVYSAVDSLFAPDNLLLQARDFDEKADEVMELYRLAVPPGEVLVGREGDRRLQAPMESTILLCGWLFLLDGLQDDWGPMVEGEPAECARQKLSCLLNEHVAKAIEIAILRRFWGEPA